MGNDQRFLRKNNIPMSVEDIYTIFQGEMYVTSQPQIIKTLLGSCIAACLYDAKTGIIGMNHFMLGDAKSTDANINQSNAGRYGIFSMELLVNQMLARGARKDRLEAKIFGGAHVLGGLDSYGDFNVPKKNCEFIQRYLKLERIPIRSSNIGGTEGMTIYFCQTNFSVYVHKIKKGQLNHELFKKEFVLSELNQKKLFEKSNVELWDK